MANPPAWQGKNDPLAILIQQQHAINQQREIQQQGEYQNFHQLHVPAQHIDRNAAFNGQAGHGLAAGHHDGGMNGYGPGMVPGGVGAVGPGIDPFHLRFLGVNGFRRNMPGPVNGGVPVNNHAFHQQFQQVNGGGYVLPGSVATTIGPDPNVTIRNAPKETFNTGKNTYTILEAIVAPNNQLEGMNDGVYLVRLANGELRIEKRIRMSTDHQKDRAADEKDRLQQLNDGGCSDHINRLYETFWLPGSSHCSLILEYCDKGNLEQYIMNQIRLGKTVHESFCWHVFEHMCAALSMSHFGVRDPLKKHIKIQNWNTICHLDIKPANIFLSSKRAPGHEGEEYFRVVLGDFGCSVSQSDILEGKADRFQQPYGTAGWYPPENDMGVNGDFQGRYGKPTDVWQMGAIIQVLCRRIDNPDMTYVDAGKACGSGYSAGLNKLVGQCMRRAVDERPTAVDAAEVIKKYREKTGWN